MIKEDGRGGKPGFPAAELGGPSEMLKLFRRTEGRGIECRRRLLWTSLNTEDWQPEAWQPVPQPLDETEEVDMVDVEVESGREGRYLSF